MRGGRKIVKKDVMETDYSLAGLNAEGDLKKMLEQSKLFYLYLRDSRDSRRLNMNFLFYGPPGTGKSELARYIANELDRELICKRSSDLLDPYVGMTERRISQAFEEAENEEAVLVIDEADSLLFSPDRAQRSWEISQTNEFLSPE